MLLLSRSFLRTAVPRTPSRFFTVNYKSLLKIYKEQGFVLIPQALQQEKAERLKSTASSLMRGMAEQPKKENNLPGLKVLLKDEYLFYSGGKNVYDVYNFLDGS